jgi:hypothetical protein
VEASSEPTFDVADDCRFMAGFCLTAKRWNLIATGPSANAPTRPRKTVAYAESGSFRPRSTLDLDAQIVNNHRYCRRRQLPDDLMIKAKERGLCG